MRTSATLAANDNISERRGRGDRVIGLAFGEAGLPVHPLLLEELRVAAGSNAYGPVRGLDLLRVAVAGYWERRGLATDPGQVVVGPGSKPLLFALRLAIGGDVLVPRPSWVSYAAHADMLGRRCWSVRTPPGEGGVPDPEAVMSMIAVARAAGRDIRQLVVTLPDNPTGSIAKPETVRRLCEVARELDLVIVSDEIYRDLIHDEATESVGPAEFAPERTVVTTGLSKSLALGGWRLGVARFPDSPIGHRLKADVTGIASEVWSTPANPVQRAAALAFDEPPELVEHVRRSARLHGLVAAAVADRWKVWGPQPYMPQAGFYVYPDLGAHREHLAKEWGVRTGTELAALLLERYGIGVLPGHAFGERDAELRLRIATPMYGDGDEQRGTALTSADPLELPWIADTLNVIEKSLADLLDAGARKA